MALPTLVAAQEIYQRLAADAGVLATVGRWLEPPATRRPSIFMSSEPPVDLSTTPGDTLWPVIVFGPVRQGFSTVNGQVRSVYASLWEVQARVPGFDYSAAGPTVEAFDAVFQQVWVGTGIWKQATDLITYQAPDEARQMWCYLGYRYELWAQPS